jgi:hypothetical protein
MLRFDSHLMPRITPDSADQVEALMTTSKATRMAAIVGLPSTDIQCAPVSENTPLASCRAP